MGSRRALFTTRIVGGSAKETAVVHIVLLGELGVGKSALTVKYITRRFIMEYDPTLEDTYSKTECLDNQEISVKIMDTYDKEGANPERYLKWAHGYIVVYSITNRGSFDTAKSYLDTVTQYHRQNGRDVPVALVGNKMDLERYRTVSKKSGEALAGEYDTTFHETSAADDFDSVAKVFHSLIRDIVREQQVALQPLVISEEKAAAAVLSASCSQPSGGRTNLRRVKSPKANEPSSSTSSSASSSSAAAVATSTSAAAAAAAANAGKKADDKDQKAIGARRPGVGLRLFKVNKSFKIFN